MQQPGRPGQRPEAARPLEQGRAGARQGIAEARVPVHAAAEGLVAGVAAPAQRIMLGRGALGAGGRLAVRAGQRDGAGDPVRAVGGHLDRRPPGVVPVDVPACLVAAERVGQRAGRAVPDGADDLVHPPAAGGHEGLRIGAENRRQPVRAVAGVLADAPVIEDRDLLAVVGIAPVGDPLGVPGVAEPVRVARAVTGGLRRGRAAPAQRELGRLRRRSRGGRPGPGCWWPGTGRCPPPGCRRAGRPAPATARPAGPAGRPPGSAPGPGAAGARSPRPARAGSHPTSRAGPAAGSPRAPRPTAARPPRRRRCRRRWGGRCGPPPGAVPR